MLFFGVLILSCGVFANEIEVPSCTSSMCQEVGSTIIGNIDTTVDPCTNFFQHACGGWIEKHPVKISQSMTHQFDLVEENVKQNLKALLDNQEDETGGAIRKARDFYRSCMDQETINNLGLQPLLAILTANGDWPLTVPPSAWNPQNLTWQKIHDNFMKVTEYSGLFGIAVRADSRNSSARIITLGSMDKSNDQLLFTDFPVHESTEESDVVKRSANAWSYDNFVLRVAREFTKLRGLNVSDADLQTDVEEMFAFVTELRQQNDTESEVGSAYQIMTIGQAQTIWNTAVNNNPEYKVEWLKTIKKMFKGTGIVINRNEKLAVRPANYLQRIATVLAKTPVRTIVNYIHWYAVNNLLPHFEQIMRGFMLPPNLSEQLGILAMPERWRLCTLFHEMPHAVSYMYVKSYFNTQTRASVMAMLEQIRNAAKEKINNAHWMDLTARTSLVQQIDNMNNKIGYPDWYDVPGQIDNYYNQLNIGQNYFQNLLAVTRFNRRRLLRKLRYPDADAPWGMNPTEVNAEYVISKNSLNFPAAIFQMPLYNIEQPAALRFGGLGAIIAQEMSHGFFNHEQLNDGNANNQISSQSMINSYQAKITCITDQYSRYEITNNTLTGEPVNVDGAAILEQCLSDNLGIPISYNAFQKYKILHPNQGNKIPALTDYSDEKLYFYGLANIYCADVNPGFLEYFYSKSRLAPNKVRVNAALSNMAEFSTAFGCAAGSKMNPTDKCVFWN